MLSHWDSSSKEGSPAESRSAKSQDGKWIIFVFHCSTKATQVEVVSVRPSDSVSFLLL